MPAEGFGRERIEHRRPRKEICKQMTMTDRDIANA
jgi:hypothetical protein